MTIISQNGSLFMPLDPIGPLEINFDHVNLPFTSAQVWLTELDLTGLNTYSEFLPLLILGPYRTSSEFAMKEWEFTLGMKIVVEKQGKKENNLISLKLSSRDFYMLVNSTVYVNLERIAPMTVGEYMECPMIALDKYTFDVLELFVSALGQNMICDHCETLELSALAAFFFVR
eukprot:UN26411